MKKIVSILLFLCSIQFAHAQDIEKLCTSKMRKTAKPKVDSVLLKQRLKTLGITATKPYLIKLFVVIFADNDGSNVAATQDDVRRQIANMRDFFSSHDICFALGAIQRVNSTTLNYLNADEEEGPLSEYARSGLVTVFIHKSLFDSDGSVNGTAWGIPNNYLSVRASAIADTNNISTLSHEMGHCFGLYHTFENIFFVGGEENVARSGDCKDCDTDGDYLCDTQADRDPISLTFIDPVTCTYTGNRRDDCGFILLMEPENIMSYGRRPCRKRFTAGQGNRCRNHIVSESILSDALAGDNFNIFFPSVSTSDYKIYVARNTVTFGANGWLSTGSAKVSATANAIVVKAGTQFQPTANAGYAVLRVNPFCQ